MTKIRYMAISALGATLLSAGSLGVVGATSVSGNSSNGNSKPHSSLGLPIRHQRLLIVSEVLNTSTNNVISARKSKTLDQLISKAGLTRKEFNTEVRNKLISDLESNGYSKDQIIIALQRQRLNHYRREDRREHKT